MERFIMKPIVNLYPGIRVTKDTVLEYKNDKVEQKVEELVLHSIIRTSSEKYESVSNVKVNLEEGDILIFEDEGRGYVLPVEQFCTIAEAIDDLENIKDLG